MMIIPRFTNWWEAKGAQNPGGKRKKTPVGMLKTNSSQEFQHNMYNATMPFLSDWRVPSDPTSTSLGTWWFRADKFCFFGAVARSFHMSEVLSMTKDSIVNEGQFTQSSSTSSTLAVKKWPEHDPLSTSHWVSGTGTQRWQRQGAGGDSPKLRLPCRWIWWECTKLSW